MIKKKIIKKSNNNWLDSFEDGGPVDPTYWRNNKPMVNDPSMDAISKVLLFRNQDKNFMQRAAGFGYQGSIPTKDIPDQDPESTDNSNLLMGSGDYDVFPSIIQTGPEQLSYQPLQTKEFITTPSWDVADYFATKGYKRAANSMYGMKYKNGGWLNNYATGGVTDPPVNPYAQGMNPLMPNTFVSSTTSAPIPVLPTKMEQLNNQTQNNVKLNNVKLDNVEPKYIPKTNVEKMDSIYRDFVDKKIEPILNNDTINYNYNAIPLTQGRYNLGLLNKRIVDKSIDAAKKANIPVLDLLAVSGRESTFVGDIGAQKYSKLKGIDKFQGLPSDFLFSNWNPSYLKDKNKWIPNGYLANKSIPGIDVLKDQIGWFYGRNDSTVNANINQKTLDNYASYLNSIKINPINTFDDVANRIKNNQMHKYNPGDPDYQNKLKKEKELLLKEPYLNEYLKTGKTKFKPQFKNGGWLNSYATGGDIEPEDPINPTIPPVSPIPAPVSPISPGYKFTQPANYGAGITNPLIPQTLVTDAAAVKKQVLPTQNELQINKLNNAISNQPKPTVSPIKKEFISEKPSPWQQKMLQKEEEAKTMGLARVIFNQFGEPELEYGMVGQPGYYGPASGRVDADYTDPLTLAVTMGAGAYGKGLSLADAALVGLDAGTYGASSAGKTLGKAGFNVLKGYKQIKTPKTTIDNVDKLNLNSFKDIVNNKKINNLKENINYELSTIPKKISPYYQKEASNKLKSGNSWSKEWYNHPETKQRLKTLSEEFNLQDLKNINRDRALTRNSPDNLKYHTQEELNNAFPDMSFSEYSKTIGRIDNKWDQILNNINKEPYIGKFQSKDSKLQTILKGEARVHKNNYGSSGHFLDKDYKGVRQNLIDKYSPNIESTTIHEGNHSFTNGNNWIPQTEQENIVQIFGDNTKVPKRNAEGKFNTFEEYFQNPTEVYARIMQLRKYMGVKPGEIVDGHKFFGMMAKGRKGETPVDSKFFDLIKDTPKFKDLFNRLPVVTGAVTATGLALQQNKKQSGGWLNNYK